MIQDCLPENGGDDGRDVWNHSKNCEEESLAKKTTIIGVASRDEPCLAASLPKLSKVFAQLQANEVVVALDPSVWCCNHVCTSNARDEVGRNTFERQMKRRCGGQ